MGFDTNYFSLSPRVYEKGSTNDHTHTHTDELECVVIDHDDAVAHDGTNQNNSMNVPFRKETYGGYT